MTLQLHTFKEFGLSFFHICAKANATVTDLLRVNF